MESKKSDKKQKYSRTNFRFRKNAKTRDAVVTLVTEETGPDGSKREIDVVLGLFDIPDYFLKGKGKWGAGKREEYAQCLADRGNRMRGLSKKDLARCKLVKPKALTPVAAMIMPQLKQEVKVEPMSLKKAESEKMAAFINTEGRSLQPIYALFRNPPEIVEGDVSPVIDTPIGPMKVLRAKPSEKKCPGETKKQLYERAVKEKVPGRSKMTKDQLCDALAAIKTKA